MCIEYLLLCNDSIAISGLGTFVAELRDSVYDNQEETLIPPRRCVNFRADVGQEAFLATVALRQLCGVPQEEVERRLYLWTEEFWQTISDDGCVEFGSVGTFTTEDDGRMVFTPSQSGITCPEYYALDAVHIPRMEVKKGKKSPIIRSDAKDITIRLNKSFLSNAAAACLTIVLFFSFSTRLGDSVLMSLNEVNAGSLFIPEGMTTPVDDSGITVAACATASAQAMAENNAEEPVATATEETEKEGRFCIVLASAVSQKNATDYVASLQARGYDTARILEGKILRVAVGNYATENEAYNAARKLHGESAEFQSAWVFDAGR